MENRQGCLVAALLAGDVGVIAHQANCFNTMASGVAKVIRECLPEAYAADLRTTKGDKSKLGKYSMAASHGGLVFNLYGQFDYGRREGWVYTRIEELAKSLRAMDAALFQRGYSGKIGLPKLGCGLGGADWEQVEQLIRDTLHDYEVIIYTL